MMRSTLAQASAALALLVPVLLATPAAAQGRKAVESGDEVTYNFRDPLVNGLGLTNLKQLRGKPVLIDLWGTR